MERNPKARFRSDLAIGKVYAGEGPLHAGLRALNLSLAQFAEIAGISYSVAKDWCGHPLLSWPLRMLDYYGRMRAMEDYLRARGVDLEQFKTKVPTELLKAGRYPRKKGDLDLSKIPLGSFNPLDRF